MWINANNNLYYSDGVKNKGGKLFKTWIKKDIAFIKKTFLTIIPNLSVKEVRFQWAQLT